MKSIPKIYALGHRYTQSIFEGEVWVQEKIDGSQFSFSVETGTGMPRTLHCRSKSTEINLAAPGMFAAGVKIVLELFNAGQIPDGWTFQCEYLAKPKHNVLTYACIPAGHLVLFDVRDPDGKYLPEEVDAWAKALGIQPVPTFYRGPGNAFYKDTVAELQHCPVFDLVAHDSVLGGTKVEGVVIKNYGKQHAESESGTAPMTAKIVSEQFKERHAFKSHPKGEAGFGPIGEKLVQQLRTEARWIKAIQHLKEAQTLVNAEEDIGPLVREIQRDLLEEESDWIKQQLFDEFKQGITRGVVQGFAQYYKHLLAGEGSVWQNLQIQKTTNEPT